MLTSLHNLNASSVWYVKSLIGLLCSSKILAALCSNSFLLYLLRYLLRYLLLLLIDSRQHGHVDSIILDCFELVVCLSC
jgi:hypothetical protein